jgi:hypothetical protein
MMFAQAPVNVSGGDVSGVTLTLTPGLTVSGHVVFDGASPKPDANALAAISVQLSARQGQPGPNSNTRVDSGGIFKTSGAIPGHYNVYLSPGPASWVLSSIMVDGHDVLKDGIDLTADVTGAVATFTDRAATVSGNVRAPSGALPQDTAVYLLPTDIEAWIARGMDSRSSYLGSASPSGTFSIGRVLPGEYLLVAAARPEGQPDPDFMRAVARGATKITIALGDHPTVDAPLVKIQ